MRPQCAMHALANGMILTLRMLSSHATCQPATCFLCRFARNKTASCYALGAEGAGTVAAIGEGVEDLEVCEHAHVEVTLSGPHLQYNLDIAFRMQVGDAVTVGGVGCFGGCPVQ